MVNLRSRDAEYLFRSIEKNLALFEDLVDDGAGYDRANRVYNDMLAALNAAGMLINQHKRRAKSIERVFNSEVIPELQRMYKEEKR